MKNQVMFGLMAILLIGGTILPAMSQTDPEEETAYIEVSIDKSIYDLNTPISISGQIINFVSNRDSILDTVEIIFIDPMGKTVSTSGYDMATSGGSDKSDTVTIPIKFKATPDQSGNFALSTVLNTMLFDYGTYAVQVTSYQNGHNIVSTSEFEISSVAVEESSIEQEQVPIEFDICQSLRELPTDDNVTRDLRQGSDLIECSVDRNFTVGDIIVIKGKIDPNLTTTKLSQVLISIPYAKPMVFDGDAGKWVTTTGTPTLTHKTETFRDMTFKALPEEDGSFSGFFQIHNGTFETGEYTITAKYLGHEDNQTVMIFDESVIDDMKSEFILTTDKDEYVPGETVQILGYITNVYATGDTVTVIVETPDTSGFNCTVVNECTADDSERKIIPDKGLTEHTFSWSYQLSSSDAAIGKYKVNAGNTVAQSETSFFVIEDTLATQTPSQSVLESSIVKKIIEKFNRISDSNILISLDEKKAQDSELAPRVIQGSLFTSARGQESDVNVQVSTSEGVCVIGQDTSCLVNQSTRKPGAIYEIVTIGEQNYKIRYSGPDVRLEKFSILPELSGIPIDIKDWNVQVMKDEQPTRFYYKVSYVNLE